MVVNSKKIKCPQCGTTLRVDLLPGMEHKKIMCSKCRYIAPAATYLTASGKPVNATPPAMHTSIPRPGAKIVSPGAPSPHPLRDSINRKFGKGARSLGGTVISSDTKLPMIGKLREATGRCHQLSFGLNTVGRDAPTSNAKIRLADNQNRMSREHLVIEVKTTTHKADNQPMGTVFGAAASAVTHSVRLIKQQVNKTYLNDVLMSFGFEYTLNHGDVLKLPGDQIVTFIIE